MSDCSTDIDQKCILLVEDDLIIAMMENRILSESAYKVIMARTGEQAIEIIQNEPHIDLILMDINLGHGISGTEAAEIILKERDIPLVFLSSHTEPEVVEKTEGITSYGYIVKSAGETVLLASIKMAFRLFDAKMESLKKEKALLDSETRFKALHNASFGGIVIHDQGLILECNQGLSEITGYSLDELIGMNGLLLISEKTRDYVKIQIKHKYEKPYEAIGIRKDGSEYPLRLEAREIPYKGKMVRTVEFRDISDTKIKEEALIKSQNEYKSTVDALLVGVVVHDASSKILISNHEASRILGLSHDQLIGKLSIDPYWNFIGNDGHILSFEEYPVSIVIRTKKALNNFVCGICRPDLDYIVWANVNAIPLFDDQDQLEKVVVNFVDITERKNSEQSLKKMEMMLSKMVSNINDVIVIIDENEINRYKSPNVKKIFGWDADELVGKSTWENVHPEDYLLTRHFLINLMQSENASASIECRYKCKDQTYKWVELSVINLLNDPDINGILGNYHDITDRKIIDDTQTFLLNCSMNTSSEDYFESIVKYLCEVLDVDFVCIDQIDEKREYAQTLAVYLDHQYQPNIRYSLKDAPCGQAVQRKMCVFEKNVQQLFPKDELLAQIGAESYIAYSLFNTKGIVIGLLVIIAHQPITNIHKIEKVIHLIAPNLTAELERRASEKELQNKQYILNATQKLAKIGGWEWDVNNRTMTWSDETYRIHGLDPGIKVNTSDELIQLSLDCYIEEDRQKIIKVFKDCINNGTPYKSEFTLKTHDNRVIQAFTMASPVYDGDKVIKVIGNIMDISEQKNAQMQIQKLLIEKDLLLKEVHHRIKNNMNTIYSLLMLQAQDQKEYQSKTVLIDSAYRVQSMMLLYEKLYHTEVYHSFNLKDYIPHLFIEILNTYKFKTALIKELEIDSIVLGTKYLSPIGIILNELITNSMKYAFKKAQDKKIFLSIKQVDHQIIFKYKDNGVGFPNDFEVKKNTGFGMQLIDILVKQIDGVLKIQTGPESHIFIEFPLETDHKNPDSTN